MVALALLFVATTLWLGLNLIQREVGDVRLRPVGVVLVVYAVVTAALAVVDSPWAWLLLGSGSVLWTIDLLLAKRRAVAV
jgi:hypothetical protein